MHTTPHQPFFKRERLIESKKRLILKIFHNNNCTWTTIKNHHIFSTNNSSINNVVIRVTSGFLFHIHTILKNKGIHNFLDIHPVVAINRLLYFFWNPVYSYSIELFNSIFVLLKSSFTLPCTHPHRVEGKTTKGRKSAQCVIFHCFQILSQAWMHSVKNVH